MYGSKPVQLGFQEVDCTEMMFYQYMPIKFPHSLIVHLESRIKPFFKLVEKCFDNFVDFIGEENSESYFVYFTAKHLFQQPGAPFNRPGWHSDGFLTDDINYIWSNIIPTEFNFSNFKLTPDHEISLDEMKAQAHPANTINYPDGELLRLNQYQIHRVGTVYQPGLRTFFKLSFSKEKYNLEGNSHNYKFDYRWNMKPREIKRNHPTKK